MSDPFRAMIERALDQCMDEKILDLPTKYGPAPIRIDEFLDVDVSWSEELGIKLTYKDEKGHPRFCAISDIRGMEQEDMRRAVLRPLIRKVLTSLSDDDLLHLKLYRKGNTNDPV